MKANLMFKSNTISPRWIALTAAGAVFALTPLASAIEVQEFRDKAAWEAAVGDFTTITFSELPPDTFVTDQYAHLGVTFVDGAYLTRGPNSSGFLNDGWGLDGNGPIRLEFDVPHRWIAADFPGPIKYELYRDGDLIHITDRFGAGGLGWFGGIESSEPFDTIIIQDPADGEPFLDDLHFAIPTPGALPLLLFPLLTPRRRRR